ncbi:MAG TPA: TAT-dependent nitrous-oxide reductase, partial [Candidatus Binatia bacterium]|nr:TAT-dependent nitrous-oxide reductase [Candidatus Binatia bacterium]
MLNKEPRGILSAGKGTFVIGALCGVIGAILAGVGLETTPVEARKEGGVNHVVKPGELDEYYGMWSGGQSGEVRVIGVPSLRELKRIPVFNIEPGSGWGIDNDSKAMLGGLHVGDTHHMHGSYENGTYDGRYFWVNDKANNRLARIRGDLLQTDAIMNIPHAQGTHGVFPQRFPRTEWIIVNSEFRTPLKNDGREGMRDASKYGGVHTIIDAMKMEVVAQVRVPNNLDLAATDYQGKYSFATSYNTEGGVTVSEMLASDRDALVVFNWDRIKKALASGEYETVDGVKMITGGPGTEFTLYVPIPKNPHGINISPDGKYAVVAGKVSPTASVIEIAKIADAFVGKIQPRDVVVGEPEIGLGPLHTTFDGRGNAYTSLFIDSQVVKWNLQKAIDIYKQPAGSGTAVVDRLDIHYQIGHIMASMAETKEADGRFLVALNKISKDRFLNVG